MVYLPPQCHDLQRERGADARTDINMSQNAGRIGWVGSRQHAEMRNRLSPSVTSEQIDVALTAEKMDHHPEASKRRARA